MVLMRQISFIAIGPDARQLCPHFIPMNISIFHCSFNSNYFRHITLIYIPNKTIIAKITVLKCPAYFKLTALVLTQHKVVQNCCESGKGKTLSNLTANIQSHYC